MLKFMMPSKWEFFIGIFDTKKKKSNLIYLFFASCTSGPNMFLDWGRK